MMELTRRSVLVGAAALAAPGVALAATQASKGRVLTVSCWQNYGANDPTALKSFEGMTGAKVNLVYFTSEDGLLEMLRQGGVGKIDVCLPNLEYVLQGAREGLFAPINTAKVTTWNALEPSFSQDPALRYQGHVHAVPWVQGVTALAVNPKAVTTKPTSWSILWDPASQGKVAFFDDPTTAIMTAALYLGEDPQNPDLHKVKQALLALKKNVKLFWSSGDDWTKAYLTGEITMGNLWSGLAGTMLANHQAVDFIMPEDGTLVWGDTWAIVRKTKKRDLAYAWINFMTSPAFFTPWITSPGPNQQLAVPVNLEAVKELPPAAAAKLMAGPIIDSKTKIAMQAGISTEALRKWTALWEVVKVS